MCFGAKPAQDNSAEIARQEAAARESRIKQGKGKIDEAFNVFTPEYYDQFKQDYLNYYNPQVDKQFGDARRDLRYNLERAGTANGTPGQKAFGDLTYNYDNQRQAIAADALDSMNKLRTSVEQNKSDLYNQNVSAADPSLAAISAVGRAGSLQSPQAFNPLPNLFAGAVNAGTAYLYGQNRALPAAYRQAFAPGAGGSPGSAYVVN